MLLQLVLLPSAKSDIQSAIKWYEKQKEGLGKTFKHHVVNAIDSILNPLISYGPAYMNLSRGFVKRFPYVIYFKTDSVRKRIVVYAILHEKQNKEDILKRRIDE